MATNSIPVTPTPVSGTYNPEANTYADVQASAQFPQVMVRAAQHSPPIANEFLTEITTLIFDKATLKLWIMSDGVMKSVTFS